MRTILIVQTLIIIAGAYYISTLSLPSVPVAVTPNIPTTTKKVVETKAETVVNAEPVATTTASTTVTTDMSGPHDAGMEWPTQDDIQSQ